MDSRAAPVGGEGRREGLEGRICLVTGATVGLGEITARNLAELGASVVVAGRTPEKALAAVRRIREHAPGARLDWLAADLSSQREIAAMAKEFARRYDRLDILVNNAGAIFWKRQVSIDGIEMTLAVNHVAYFLLTLLLLDKLKSSVSARIVNVASEAHTMATLDFEDLHFQRRYRPVKAYAKSKMANVLFTYRLAQELAGTNVTVNAVHPGIIQTNLGANNGWVGRLMKPVIDTLLRPRAVSQEEGVDTIVYLATSPEVAGKSGLYFVKKRPVPSSRASYDTVARDKLWEASLLLTGLSF